MHYWVYPAGAGADGADQHETVLMVHGLRGTHHGLELIAAGIARGRVIIPDLPGFGDSEPMRGRTHDTAGYADALIELIRRLDDRGRPIVLIGHSFGSIVAARIAARVPHLVRRLVLINPISTPALAGPRVAMSKLTSAYYSLGRALPGKAGHALLSSRWVVLASSRAMTRTKDKRLREFIHDSHLRHFNRFHSPAVLSETFQASVTSTVADFADAIGMPTLLIAGEHDEIAPVAGQRELADRMADARLEVLPDVGHLVHYETPLAAAAAVERFLGTP
nr:alpha/beta hydrolase [Saccharopolyspora sp. HNM0983]